MHFEVLVEGWSDKRALDILIPKIIGDQDTFRIYSYKGGGHIPRNLTDPVVARNKLLLNNLPGRLRAYGRTFASYPASYPAAVILVCDLDKKCLKAFRQELLTVLNACDPKPETRFCIAIEEGEAWLLGDIPTIKMVYPRAKDDILNGYKNDSICGTWELLADAVSPGGSRKLKGKGWQAVGIEKSAWAEKITPHMDVDTNKSSSFCYFRDKVRALVGMSESEQDQI